MKSHSTSSRRALSQRGQAFLVIVVFVGVLLLAVMGLATDYSQIWAHRQMAQGAADAACMAGAADLFLKGTDPTAAADFPALDFTWIGSTFDCSAKPTSVPCKYASVNGYSGSNVSVSFPAAGSKPWAPGIPATYGIGAATPYIEVVITDPVPMTFTRLVSNSKTVNVAAGAGCGLIPINTPVPLVVLHTTASGSLSVSGSASIKIIGGPQRSIQVNSNSATAVSVGTVDLSAAGPSGTGSDLAVFGGPTTKPGGVNVGSTGNWIPGANPFGDPFGGVAAPASAPATVGSAKPVPFGMNGCPDPSGCVELAAGNYSSCTASGNIVAGANGCLTIPYQGSNPKFSAPGGTDWQASHAYAMGALIVPSLHNSNNSMYKLVSGVTSGSTGPNPWNQTACTRQSDGSCTGGTQADSGVTWQNVGVVSLTPTTAIFDPGLYYVAANGLSFGDNSTVRMSTATGDGNKGATFYFSTSATVAVTSNSGKSSACTSASSGSATPMNCVVSYKIDGTISPTGYVASQKLQCPSGSVNPPLVPASVDGNILLGPCGPTVPLTDPYGSPDGNRGFLFFQNRATAASASWGGGGQFLSSGFLYFHKGNGTTCGTSTSCLTLKGNSGAGAYTLGNIVVDELALGGTPAINMFLNPTATFSVLRPSLLQ